MFIYCDPKSPWQPGSNENTNGLLRQYLPRTLNYRTLTQDDFDAIADKPTDDLDRSSASRHHHKHWPRCCVDRLSLQACALRGALPVVLRTRRAGELTRRR